MIFEYVSSGGPGFITAFADFIGSRIENGVITLPETLGEGHIKALDLDPLIRMIVLRFVLNEDLRLRRLATGEHSGVVTMTFHNIFSENRRTEKSPGRSLNHAGSLPSVQLTSTNIAFDTFFPANTEINTIIISVQVDFLKSFLSPNEGNTFIDTIVNGKQPYLYEEIISPQMQEVAEKIVEANVPDQLQKFYFKLMAQELIYFLLVELLKRENATIQPLNTSDVKAMYRIKDAMLSDLSSPPNLTELAKVSGMSESKMKRLFKQIFGNSIYNYYQSFRMNEAANLLKEQNLSVSETGYRLGFSNLSHFTRLFEKHIGLKPKKYSQK